MVSTTFSTFVCSRGRLTLPPLARRRRDASRAAGRGGTHSLTPNWVEATAARKPPEHKPLTPRMPSDLCISNTSWHCFGSDASLHLGREVFGGIGGRGPGDCGWFSVGAPAALQLRWAC